MAEIHPFRAVRYDPRRVALASVLTQPYDKISPAAQERYYAAHPHNLIAIEKGKIFPSDSPENNVYTRAASAFEDWLRQGVLQQDRAPAIYAYFQNYQLPGTNRRAERRGFIALGRLVDYDQGVVFRHERTLTAPKADRLELLRHTRAQTGQLFLLYEDASRRIDALLEGSAKDAPSAEVHDEGDVRHRLWAITDGDRIGQITAAMSDQKLVIADGHHRYETALAYRDECRARAGRVDPDAPFEMAMWTCFNIHQEGLTILPTHRVVSRLASFSLPVFLKDASKYFRWYSYPFGTGEERAESFGEFRRDLEKRGRTAHAIGVYAGNQAFYLLILPAALRHGPELERWLPQVSARQRELDVVLLHKLLLEKCLHVTAEKVAAEANLTYEREMEAAIAAVDHGAAQIAFLLNPVSVKKVTEIALAGELMPQKSTDFYPKLLSGLCIYKM